MLVYLCSPYRAEPDEKFQEQLEWTKKSARELVMCGYDVIVPHLMCTQFLDDNIQIEREAGMQSALRLLESCEAIFVSIKQPVSVGMRNEITLAEVKGIPVYYFHNLKEIRDFAKKQTPRNRATNAKAPHSETLKKCEDCLYHPKEGENYRIECGECSLFYGCGWESRK